MPFAQTEHDIRARRRQQRTIRIIPEWAEIPKPDFIASLMRHSSVPQEWGTSQQRQYGYSRDFCRDMKWPSPDLHMDLKGVSAFNKGGRRAKHRSTKNPFGQFLVDVQAGTYPGVVALLVEAFHRFSREEVTDAAMDLLNLLKAGVIVCLTSPSKRRIYYGNIPYDDLVEVLREMNLAHEESEVKSDLVWKAKDIQRQKTLAEGVPMPGRCPGWLEIVGYKQGTADGEYRYTRPENKAILEKIFTMAKTVGGHLIAQILNDQDVPFWNGGKWTAEYIYWLLRNPAVMGTYVAKEKVVAETRDNTGQPKPVTRFKEIGRKENVYPIAVSDTLFHQVQAAISERYEKLAGGAVGGPDAKRRYSTPYANLFRGLLFCPCGAPLRRSYKENQKGISRHRIGTPFGEFNSADEAGRHIHVSGDVIRRRIKHGETGYSWIPREPGFTSTTPFLRCAHGKDHRCGRKQTYDYNELEHQVFDLLIPDLLKTNIQPPPTNRDRIDALRAEIAEKEKAAEEMIDVYGATETGARRVRQLEDQISILRAEMGHEEHMFQARFRPDSMNELQEIWQNSKEQPDNLVELRSQLATRIRGVIDHMTLTDEGIMEGEFCPGLIEHATEKKWEGAGFRLPKPQPRVAKNRKILKSEIDPDVLRQDCIDIFQREGCTAMSSQELAEHMYKLDRPWHIVNVWQVSMALAPLGIKPRSIQFDHDRMRGYTLSQFTDEVTEMPNLVSLARAHDRAILLNELVRDVHAIFATRRAKQLSMPEILADLHAMGRRWVTIRTTLRLARVLGYAGLKTVALALPEGVEGNGAMGGQYGKNLGRPSHKGYKVQQIREVLMKHGNGSRILPHQTYNGRENIV